MSDIVVCEFMDTAALREGLAGFDVLYDPGLVDRPDELRARVAEARAIIVRNRTQVRGALLDAAGKLEAVGRLGVGLDNIDMEACAMPPKPTRPSVAPANSRPISFSRGHAPAATSAVAAKAPRRNSSAAAKTHSATATSLAPVAG